VTGGNFSFLPAAKPGAVFDPSVTYVRRNAAEVSVSVD